MIALMIFFMLIVAGVFAFSGELTLGVVISIITGLMIVAAVQECRRDREIELEVIDSINNPGSEDWELE